MHYARTKKDKAIDGVLYAVILILTVTFAYPFYYLIINSFNGLLEQRPLYLFFDSFTLNNYKIIFRENVILSAFVMSVLRTLIGVAVTTFNCAMCAYALRKRKLRFRNFYLVLFTIPMFFSGGLIPGYLNFKNLHLLDNFLVYVLPGAVSFFYIIIFMSSFNDIPDALEESATIDGAGYFTSFMRIYLPISLPVIATIALFAGVSQWNSWFDTLFYTTSPRLMTLSAYLVRIVRDSDLSAYGEQMAKDMERNAMSPEGIKFATMLVATVPITLIYPFLQKYFVKGLTIGSVKG